MVHEKDNLKQLIGKYHEKLNYTEVRRHVLEINRTTLEFIGIWEQLNNPEFNPIEFDGVRGQAGLNSFV